MVNNPTFEVLVKGAPVSFQSAFPTLAEAWKFLASLPVKSDFARDLLDRARERKLSPLQAAWIHKLATDAQARGTARPTVQVDGLNLLPVVQLTEKAFQAGKKFPQIELPLDGRPIYLKRAGSLSKHPGTVSIVRGRYPNSVFFGRIELDGAVTKGRDWTAEVEQLLRGFAKDPAKVGGQHGIATGRCVFCGRDLTTKESRSVGYGPICAEKFGLPWGDTTVADEADAAAKICEHGHTTDQCGDCSEPEDRAELEAEARSEESQDPFAGLDDRNDEHVRLIHERTAIRRHEAYDRWMGR